MSEQQITTSQTKRLRARFTTTMLAMLIALLAVVSATYAWYVYNTSRHTTKVKMAAGTGVNLQISTSSGGDFTSATMLKSFEGCLEPVSTDRIGGGFQKVDKFVAGSEDEPSLVAGVFKDGEYNAKRQDYYKTSLYLRTNGSLTDIYVADIQYEDSNETYPISSAIRVGLVVNGAGKEKNPQQEFIFAISDKHTENPQMNTKNGEDGLVLDSSKKDGSLTTVKPQLYTSDNYCQYDEATGKVELKKDSQKICEVSGSGDGHPGKTVKIDVYIWLEGCDPDCTADLCDQQLRKLAISFAGKQ